jgi:hypothetical protein
MEVPVSFPARTFEFRNREFLKYLKAARSENIKSFEK